MKKRYVLFVFLSIVMVILLSFLLMREMSPNREIINQNEQVDKANITEIPNSVDKVNIELKEGSLTRGGAIIIINDNNERHFAYSENFWLERRNNTKWESVPYLTRENNALLPLFDSIGTLPTEENPIEMYQDWKRIYGELPNGNYRLVKSVYESNNNEEEKFLYVEFSIDM